MTEAENIELFNDILKKSKIYCKRYSPDLIEPHDIANEVYYQFIVKDKAKKYNKKRGASFKTWSCLVAHNILKNYMVRKSKHKDDIKRSIADTINDKNMQYFQDMAKLYTYEESED